MTNTANHCDAGRSFIRRALTNGMAALNVAQLVGTAIGMIEKHYRRLFASAVKERLPKVRLP